MRHFGRRTRGRRKIYGQPIQHSPSLLGNNPANDTALIHILAHADQLAGQSMTAARTGAEDRTTDVDNGRHVGRMTLDIGFTVSASTGYYEYALVKYERSTSVPTIGVDPVPSSADIVSDGLQRAVRSFTPGYVIKFGLIAITPQTNRIVKIKADWAKFGKAQVRDGDYYALIVFNRTDAAPLYDIHIRYKTYTVK